jgi:hypothetical protein
VKLAVRDRPVGTLVQKESAGLNRLNRPNVHVNTLASPELQREGLLRWRGGPLAEETGRVIMSTSISSAPAGYRFPREVIAVAVCWYLRYGLSYRDVEELLAERGIDVDHVTMYRWVQTFTPEFIDAARPSRHASGDRWFVDETNVKGRRPLDLLVPRCRSARSGHRRSRLATP